MLCTVAPAVWVWVQVWGVLLPAEALWLMVCGPWRTIKQREKPHSCQDARPPGRHRMRDSVQFSVLQRLWGRLRGIHFFYETLQYYIPKYKCMHNHHLVGLNNTVIKLRKKARWMFLYVHQANSTHKRRWIKKGKLIVYLIDASFNRMKLFTNQPQDGDLVHVMSMQKKWDYKTEASQSRVCWSGLSD